MRKKVRILLRVSSNQQLEADGDLSVQRQLATEYVETHTDWMLDCKEYFEGSNSGYKNAVADRDILNEIYDDAKAGEFDILVVYKDDRLGRRMWEIGAYVMSLKSLGIDIYTVKDGCISPESDDIMGQMVLALRYGNAQKSSSDTGQRVKDTAKKLVQKGKFMGGAAPYGYVLEYSNEISKHGRALKHLVVVPGQAEVVKHIFDLSLNKEYGSAKIAKALNQDDEYRLLAPNDVWKSGTITSILTNPIYMGHTAYKRRERINGKYRKSDSSEWVLSVKADEKLTIIDEVLWYKVQEKRKLRSCKYAGKTENKNISVIGRNDGSLALIDVLHCGCCGCRMINGSRYSYWTIQKTGERKKKKIPIYKCPKACQGVPHEQSHQYRADKIEPAVFDVLAYCIGILLDNEDISMQIKLFRDAEKASLQMMLDKEKEKLAVLQQRLAVMEDSIPDAMLGEYPLSLEELVPVINRHKEKLKLQQEKVRLTESDLKAASCYPYKSQDVNSSAAQQVVDAPQTTWQSIFLNSDAAGKRILADKLIEQIDITGDEITVRFKISIHLPRISGCFGVQKQGL